MPSCRASTSAGDRRDNTRARTSAGSCASCGARWTARLLHNRSGFFDKQVVKVQESPDAIPEGETPLTVARYELRGPSRQVSDRPTILEMLAYRRAAQRCVELTETFLLAREILGQRHGRRFVRHFAQPLTHDELLRDKPQR